MNGVTRVLVRAYTMMNLWYWAIILTVMAGLAGFGGMLGFNMAHRELWAAVTDAPQKYVISVVGILAVTNHLPIHIANGVSRRNFARGAAVFGALCAVGFSVLTLGGYGMQALILSARGMSDAYPAISLGDVATTSLGLLLINACYLCGGWLIGAGFYRYGVWWGLLFAVVAVLPGVAGDVALGGRVDDGTRLATSVLLAVCSIAAGVVGCYAIVRTMPVRPRKA